MSKFEAELAADAVGWFKSTRSAANCTCVEVRFWESRVQVRDGKVAQQPGINLSEIPVITVSVADWTAFLVEVSGQFGSGSNPAISIVPGPEGDVTLLCRVTGTELAFNAAEWDAFVAGVRNDEFAPKVAAPV